MASKLRFLGLATALSPLVWLIQTTACTGDDSASGGAGTAGMAAATGGNGATSTGGTGAGAPSGGTPAAGGSAGAATTSGSACANPIVLLSTKPGIADFENYKAMTDLATWSFPLGADTSTGALAGTFGYGDESTGQPALFEMAAGHASMYALHIADPMSKVYGGGMGLWLSACLNGTAFSGVSFWVKGSSPSPTATFSLGMGDTLSSTPSKAGAPFGTCSGTSTTCINPTFAFPVTADWVQIKAAWSGFKAGDAAGTSVAPDGKDITQLQWGVGLNFVPTVDGGTDYEPVPGAYDLAVDDVTFY